AHARRRACDLSGVEAPPARQSASRGFARDASRPAQQSRGGRDREEDRPELHLRVLGQLVDAAAPAGARAGHERGRGTAGVPARRGGDAVTRIAWSLLAAFLFAGAGAFADGISAVFEGRQAFRVAALRALLPEEPEKL